MKMDHTVSYFSKYPNEKFGIEYDFTNDLDTSETLTACTATITDSSGNDYTTGMISSRSTSTPKVTFTIASGIADTSYQIKLAGTTSNSNVLVHYITCEVFGPVTLTAYVAGPSSNSYVTLEEANDYIRNKRGHDNVWDTLSDEGKKRILIEATREIDIFNFNGERYYEMQALSFPRDDHEVEDGNCSVCTTTSFRDAELYDTTYGKKWDNYWKYGSVHITSGTPVNEIRNISLSNNTNGSITVDTAFSSSPTTNSEYIVFAPIDDNVKNAQCEQVLYIVDNSNIETLQNYNSLGAEEVKIGDTRIRFKKGSGVSKSTVAPLAKKLLSRWIRQSIRLGRG